MDRRDTLRRLMLATGGLVVLPAWANGWKAADVAIPPASFTPSEQELLSAIADAIIPTVEGVGAVSTATDKYLQRVIADCYDADTNDNVRKQLAALDEKSKSDFGKSFANCSEKERVDILQAFGDSDDKEQKDFFKLIKSETIRGFTTCEEVMTKFLDYKMAPGHYYGCVDINS